MRRRLIRFAARQDGPIHTNPTRQQTPLEFPVAMAIGGMVYAATHTALYPYTGAAISALALALVVPGALRYGLKGGLSFATLGTALNLYLIYVFQGYDEPRGFGASLSGGLMLYLTAATLGLLHGALRRLRAEVSMRKQAEARMQQLANHDALTGLPNRRYFTERATTAVSAATTQDPCALLLLDLNGFKAVNDTLGHDAGDTLLQSVARRLQQTLREHDPHGRHFLARLGGDEFAVILPGVQHARDVRTTATHIEAAFTAPFHLSGTDCHTSPSIGGAIAPEHATTAETLLAQADQAMYRAKRSGTGFAMHDDPDRTLKRRRSRTLA